MPNLLFIYSKGNAELCNRQSALGSYILTLSELFFKNGHSVTVNDTSIKELKKNTTTSLNSSEQKRFLSMFLPKIIKEYLKDLTRFRGISQLVRKIKSTLIKPDFIIEFYSLGSTMGHDLASHYQVPLVIVYDAPVLEEHEFFNGKKLFFRKKMVEFAKRSLESASHVIVYSTPVYDYLIHQNIQIKSYSCHQNIDFSRFEPIAPREINQTINIGFLGSFLKWHNCENLVFTFSRLSKKYSNIRLLLVGYGQEYQRIKDIVKELNLDNLVEMPGFVDGPELNTYKKRMHIGIMPGSNWYGAPNKMFEYGAAGLAVIGPTTPTIQAIFDNRCGALLFNPNDELSLEKCLEELIADAALLHSKAKKFQDFILNNYSESVTFSHYQKIFDSLALKN